MGRYPYKKNQVKKMLEDGTLELLALGCDTEKQIYHECLGINQDYWIDLKKQIPELSELMIRTIHTKFRMLTGANMKKGLGYDYKETEVSTYVDKNGQEHETLREMTKHCPPDVNAQKLALANLVRRARKLEDGAVELEWSNSTETVEVKAEGSISLAIDEEIANILKELDSDRG